MIGPYLENSFAIELTTATGEPLGYFSAITGGSMSIVVVGHTLMYPEGGSRGIYIPSCTSFEPITLSFGVTDDMTFWNWWIDMSSGKRNRINASIFALGPNYLSASTVSKTVKTDGEKIVKEAINTTVQKKLRRVAQWDLQDVWPSRISGFHFDVDSNKYMLASVTLIAEDISRITIENEV